MKNVINQKIFVLAEEIVNNNMDLSVDYFTQHIDPDISQLSANLCSTKHHLSPIWAKRGAPMIDEEKKLNEILEDIFIKYKLNIVIEAKKDLQKKLKSAKQTNSEHMLLEILSKINTTNEIIKKLSELQGRVII